MFTAVVNSIVSDDSPAGDHGVDVGAERGRQHGRLVVLQAVQRGPRRALVPGAHAAVPEAAQQLRAAARSAAAASPQRRRSRLALWMSKLINIMALRIIVPVEAHWYNK